MIYMMNDILYYIILYIKTYVKANIIINRRQEVCERVKMMNVDQDNIQYSTLYFRHNELSKMPEAAVICKQSFKILP
jgi:hypothetical protein